MYPGRRGAVKDDAGEVLDIYLVNNACSWGDNPEIIEGARTPSKELVALVIALVFNFNVLLDGIFRTERFDNHRVVNNHLCRVERVNRFCLATQRDHSVANRSEVNDTGDTREVLHEDAGWGELNLSIGLCARIPVRNSFDVVNGSVLAILVTEEVLSQNFEGVR